MATIKCPVSGCGSTGFQIVQFNGINLLVCNSGHVISRDYSAEMTNMAREIRSAVSGVANPNHACLVRTVSEFGKRWGHRKTTVYKWIAKGMPHMKISARDTKIPIAEADRWMKETFLRQREC